MPESSALSPTAQRALKSAHGILLDIGCGAHKHPNAFGMDVRPCAGVDLVWDLTKTPWPLPDNCAHTVIMSHVWEHIPPWHSMAVMEEIHRVSKPAAGVFIAGPYALGFRYVQDPTHCNPANEATWAYWDPAHVSGLWTVYKPSPLHLIEFKVVPAGNDRDFNCVLSVCKDRRCPKCVPFRVAMADGSAMAAPSDSCLTLTSPSLLRTLSQKKRSRPPVRRRASSTTRTSRRGRS